MSDSLKLKVKGWHKVLRKLDAAEKQITPAVRSAANHIKTNWKEYPPPTSANRPKTWSPDGNNSWYVRGWGTKWVRKDGSVRGNRTSKNLRAPNHWRISINDKRAEISVSGVPYAVYVIGEKQADFHGRRGWRKGSDVLEKEQEKIEKFFTDYISKGLRS